MNEVKYCRNSLWLYDFRGVEEHLSAMAARGWRLERAGNNFWKYRRGSPARVRYAVTYHDGASPFNPGPTEGQRSLEELCAAAGWAKVSDWGQAQIFSTEDENAVPLETDEALRLQNIHRSIKKSFLPANILLLAMGLLMSASLASSLVTGRVFRLLSSNARLLSGTLFLLLAVLQIYTLSHYYRWRRRSRRSVEDGGPCLPAGRGYRRVSRAGEALLAVLVAAYLLAEFFAGNRGMVLFYGAYTALLTLLYFLVRRTTALLRKRKASKGINMALTLAVDVVLAFAITGGLTFAAIRFDWSGIDSGETYEYRGQEWDAAPREDVPLTLAELTGERYDHVRRRLYREGSFFLPARDYTETALLGDGPKVCGLSYTLWEPRSPGLREALLEELLEDGEARFRGTVLFTRRYVPEDPAPWGAEAAYRRYYDDHPSGAWLLVWPGRVAEVDLEDAEPTEERMARIAAHLGPGA